MQALVWAGAAMTLAGLVLIVLVIRKAIALRGAALPDDQLRAGLGRLLPLNFGAVALSFLGLGLVVAGVLLG